MTIYENYVVILSRLENLIILHVLHNRTCA